jgi:hypothetical protein
MNNGSLYEYAILKVVAATDKLTDKQHQILIKTLEGKSYQDIAKDLGLATKTIANQASALWKILSILLLVNITPSNVRNELSKLLQKEEYLEIALLIRPYIKNRCGILDLPIPKDQNKEGLQIDHLYVKRRFKCFKSEQTYDILEKLKQQFNNQESSRFLIYGQSGIGKTSLLRYLAIQCNQQEFNNYSIPIYISLRRYVNYVHDEGKQSLFSYISTIFKNVELSNDQFLIKLERNLLNGKAIIFLDGLDAMELEPPNSINIVERFIEEYPECAFIISSRNKSMLSSKRFNEYELQKFNTEESKEFVKKWFSYYGGTSFIEETKKSLIKMITDGEIKEFFSIPLYISLICIILSSENKENKNADIQQILSSKDNENGYEFILQELILINKATLKLLEPDPHESNFEKNHELDKIYENISSFVKARLLSHIAIEMMKQGDKVYIKFNELISYTAKFLFYIPEAEEKEEFRLCSKNILLAIELYDGLLVRRIIGKSNEYSFIHIKIRNFFAALYISFASYEEQKEIWEEYVSISTDDSKNSKETNKENWKNIFLHAKIMLKWRENQIQEQQNKLNQLIKK